MDRQCIKYYDGLYCSRWSLRDVWRNDSTRENAALSTVQLILFTTFLLRQFSLYFWKTKPSICEFYLNTTSCLPYFVREIEILQLYLLCLKILVKEIVYRMKSNVRYVNLSTQVRPQGQWDLAFMNTLLPLSLLYLNTYQSTMSLATWNNIVLHFLSFILMQTRLKKLHFLFIPCNVVFITLVSLSSIM